mgnify:CR=1 FL=1
MAASSVAWTANEESRLSLPGALAPFSTTSASWPLGGGTGLPTVLRGLRAGLFESHPWDLESATRRD